ncbi:MAG: hypothetical protein AAF871_08625 [Pseudomonadota bacterium]
MKERFLAAALGRMARAGLVLTMALAGPVVAAPNLASCEAKLAWNGANHSFKDHGQGLVEWTYSWSGEGVAEDLYLFDCGRDEGVKARVKAERMGNPIPYDRRPKARRIVDRAVGARAFFTFERLAALLEHQRIPVTQIEGRIEPCPCAVLYPKFGGPEIAPVEPLRP